MLCSACGSAAGNASNETKGEPKVSAKTAVVYFSASGNTEKVAKTMSEAIGAKLVKITPAKEYSNDDLNYRNKNSRSCKENAEPMARPELAGDYTVLKDADTIILGYPIWWNRAPKIVNTFLEKTDLSGKKIYLFSTSGGSGIEGSAKALKNEYPKLNFVDAKEFSSRTSQSEVKSWLK